MDTYVAYLPGGDSSAGKFDVKHDPGEGFFAKIANGWRVFRLGVDPIDGKVIASEVVAEISDAPVVIQRQVVKIGGVVVTSFDSIKKAPEPKTDDQPPRLHVVEIEATPPPAPIESERTPVDVHRLVVDDPKEFEEIVEENLEDLPIPQ